MAFKKKWVKNNPSCKVSDWHSEAYKFNVRINIDMSKTFQQSKLRKYHSLVELQLCTTCVNETIYRGTQKSLGAVGYAQKSLYTLLGQLYTFHISHFASVFAKHHEIRNTCYTLSNFMRISCFINAAKK